MHSFLTLGEEVAGYRLESVIGRGGMAVVYRAADLRLGRQVAMKVIAPHLAENERFRQRFVRESKLAASIDHPNIIPIYDAGEASGLLYTVMRYVDGMDLRAVLERDHRLEPGQVLDLFSQVASALDAAHAHNLVHRDVKPGNILIASGGGGDHLDHAYLTDFGLTKRSASASDLTTAGHFVGTIDYIAPEQISSKPVDCRADIYALGCAMFHCLAGTLPFTRDDDAATLWAHMLDPVPALTAHRPDLPRGVDDVFYRAMAKSPADRYPTCRAVVAALRTELGATAGTLTLLGQMAAPPAPIISPRDIPIGSDDNHDGRASAPATTAEPPTATVAAAAGAESLLTRLARWRRRWPMAVAAVAAVLVAAAAVVTVHRSAGPAFVRFAGDAGLPASLDHPAQWRQRARAQDTFRLFSPVDITGLFASADWTGTDAALAGDPAAVAGVYLRATDSGFDTSDSDDLQSDVNVALHLFGTTTATRDTIYPVAQHWAVRFTGTLAEPNGPGRLQYSYYVVPTDVPGVAVEMMMVGSPTAFAQDAAVFDRTLDSLDVSRVTTTS